MHAMEKGKWVIAKFLSILGVLFKKKNRIFFVQLNEKLFSSFVIYMMEENEDSVRYFSSYLYRSS